MTQPDLFSHYMVASPSLWWNQEWLPRQTLALLADIQPPSPTQLRLSVGSQERARAGVTPERAAVLTARRPVATFSAFAEQLQAAADTHQWPLHMDVTLLDGLDHGMARDRALMDGFHQFVRAESP